MPRAKYTAVQSLESTGQIRVMSPELIAIIVATAALGALILTTTARLGQRIDRVDRDVADLRERMARLEGLFEGFMRREPATPGTGTA